MPNRIDKVLREFTAHFVSNPFDFLKEADIQSLLFARLYDAIQEKIPIERKTKGSFIEMSPVKTEYTTDPRIYSQDRLDIVILDSRQAVGFHDFKKKYPSVYVNNEVLWRQEASVAIEIKYCQLGDKLKDKFSLMLNDLERLRKYAEQVRRDQDFVGIALLFIQPHKSHKAKQLDWVLYEGIRPLRKGIQGWVVSPEFEYSLDYPQA